MVARLFAAFHDKGHSVRANIVAVVAAILIPALVFGGWLTLHAATSERELLERNSESKARQVEVDIEHEIATAKAVLVALSGSFYLQSGNFTAFHRQCVEVARQLGVQVTLRDAVTGNQIINAAIPWGETLPQNIPQQTTAAMYQALSTGKPSVSNVFYGPILKQHLIAVGVPVLHDGNPTHFLAIGIPVDVFAAALSNAALPDQWVISLVDSEDTIVARSNRHSELAGSKVINNVSGRPGADGIAINADRFGVTYRWVWRRSENLGWTIAVGIPLTVLEAPAASALQTYVAAGGTLFAVAVLVAFGLGGVLERTLGRLGVDRPPTKEEFRILFESAPNGVLVVDANGTMLLANERLEKKFGYSRDELIGQPVEMLIPERIRTSHAIWRNAFNTAPTTRPMGAGLKLQGRRKDGSEFSIEVGLSPFATRSGRFVMATVVDISERLSSERRLSAALNERDSLRRRFMQAQEDERLRLAHELHDQTGQNLTAALFELKGLETLLKEDGRHRARALRGEMEQIGKTLHRIAWELRPASIDELGLTSALGNYISEWSNQFDIDADFHCRYDRLDGLPDETRTALYRIVQEALTNVAKHARDVTAVSVIIDRRDGTLTLTVEDDGKGFDAANGGDNGRERGGLGLVGMRERIELIGGEFEIETAAGAGTTVFARIPLDRERKTA
jgi:PAS domain S-box-containing protein